MKTIKDLTIVEFIKMAAATGAKYKVSVPANDLNMVKFPGVKRLNGHFVQEGEYVRFKKSV